MIIQPFMTFLSKDINECDNPDICPKNSECQNSIGSYACSCLAGFQGKKCKGQN